MRGEFSQAALFISFAFVLDMLDGRVARLTGTASAFGLEFDSLADVISVRRGARDPGLHVGTAAVRPPRLGGRLPVRLGRRRSASRFNIQTPEPGQALLRRHAESRPPRACRPPRSSRIPAACRNGGRVLALPMVLIPAFLMVSTIRYRSFKTFDLGTRRSYAT